MSSLTKTFKLSKNAISTWIIATLVLCLNFAPLLFNFIWGNHDWMPLLAGSTLKSGLIEGRFSQYIFINLLFDGNILPILNIVFGFLLYSFSIVLLTTKVFSFNTKSFASNIIILSAITLPYIIEILYFQFICLSQLIWPLIITLSIIFIQKATTEHKIINTLIGTILLLLAIGGYPASINMYITISCLLFIQLNNSTLLNLKTNIIKFIPFIISAITSLIILKVIYIYLQNNNLMLTLYNNSTIGLANFASKLHQTVATSILSLLQPLPFFNALFKLTSFAIFILFAINYIFSAKKNQTKLIHTALIITLLICIKFSAFLTNETSDNYFAQFDPIGFMVRTDFYSIPTLLLFSLFYLNNKKKYIYKNIVFTLSIILLWLNLNANYTFCKTSLLGFKAENMLTDRIITRIHSHPEFNSQKAYSLLQIGEISLRPKYYTPNTLEKYGYYTLNTPFTRFWVAQEYYNFYTTYDFVANSNNLSPQNLDNNFNDFISNKIKTWPNQDSIYIDNSHILVIMNDEMKQSFKQQFNLLSR